MICSAPLFFVLMMTPQGPQYLEVAKKYLKPEIQKFDSEEYHAECRKRDLGDCLGSVRLNPHNGHITFLCKRLESVDNDRKRTNDTSSG